MKMIQWNINARKKKNARKCKRISNFSAQQQKKISIGKKHINNTKKNCYATLKVLRKIKRYAPLPVRKQLPESLILSIPDYYNELLFDLPKCMKQQLQKVQNAAAGFVLNK